MGSRRWLQSIIILIIVIFLVSISTIAKLFTDYWWFQALNFSKIFIIILKSKVALFAAAALIFFLLQIINFWLSKGRKNIISPRFSVIVLLLISVFIGMSFSGRWLEVQSFFHQVPFNIQDPIFGHDVAFYVFTLPFLNMLWAFFFTSVIFSVAVVFLNYTQAFFLAFFKPRGDLEAPQFNFRKILKQIKGRAYVHIGILISLFFVLLSLRHYLSQFSIMYSNKGIVVGAGYTDVMIYLPVMKILIALAIISGIFILVWAFSKRRISKRHIAVYILILYAIFGFLGPTVIPSIVQSLKVSPNELNLEKPYIANNIKFTRLAYGLNDVEVKNFSAFQDLNSTMIQSAKPTIDNVRILDWRPLLDTYKQMQEIRLYYDLPEVDIDRYDLNGISRQVMLSARELDQRQIAENAQTWVNLHMVYTHGYGVVMSPVNYVTEQGLPNYFIKDIPPVYTIPDKNIRITKPQIYYGEKYNDFVLVDTDANEFDYPKGDSNQYTNYDGTGGIKLISFWRKLLMAIRFSDIKILLSSDINKDSKIMFDRNVQDRIRKLTPFLSLDRDPYLVINEGKLYWIQDAYTVTGNYPYSQKIGSINYIRNSVKVIVNAYNGSVDYYITDLSDPLIQTYAKIFPGQFKMIDSMPSGLKEHIRYPEDLFKIQSAIYNIYHMGDVSVFYNKEDAWQAPSEVYGVGQKVDVDPYYMILNLPDQDNDEFVLMTTFTPIKKDNMVAWMAARCDGNEYGKLILYRFPKDKLIYGPLQIEARFDQDSDISQQLTLWSQQGSSVTRGNLLVIPINNSLLYIEPLYIQAETGQLPELKRVLVSDGEGVAMEKTLGDALDVLFGKVKKETPSVPEQKTQKEMIEEANNIYEEIVNSMKEGNWTGFGDNFQKLGEVLNKLY